MFPLFSLGVLMLAIVLIRIDPRLRKQSPEARTRTIGVVLTILIGLCGFLAVLGVSVIGHALGKDLSVPHVCLWGMVVLFLVIGNQLGRLKPNYFAGIRTPWTLESPEVWRRTHRLGGWVFVVVSLFWASCLATMNLEMFYLWSLIPGLLVILSFSFIYPWFIYRRLDP